MYEDYMLNYLNYPRENGYEDTYQYEGGYRGDLDEYYPEIYKIVYPMVKKVCYQNNRGFNKEILDNMVEEVYRNVEVIENEPIELNITLENDIRGESTKEEEELKEKVENRQVRRNNNLNDIIRILILREILQNNCPFGPNCPPRPPMPPRPPRPPMPPRPPVPPRPPMPPRPPIMPRSQFCPEYERYRENWWKIIDVMNFWW